MPYISEKDRKNLPEECRKLLLQTQYRPGQLNFIITTLLIEYINILSPRYDTYNEVIGVLECAKQEFYRRAVAKYEDKKIDENGDVYED